MKKIILISLCYLCLCGSGCENSNNGYQISELIPNTYLDMAHLKGTIKNVSNNNCKEVLVQIEFSSGTIKDEGWIYIDSPKKGSSLSFNEILIGASGIEDIENYNIKLKNIKCKNT